MNDTKHLRPLNRASLPTEESRRYPLLRSINIFAGFPRLDLDPKSHAYDPTRGYGDIASNIHQALAMGRMCPHLTINLCVLVASGKVGDAHLESPVPKLKALLPGIDPTDSRPQFWQGIHIYFIQQVPFVNPSTEEIRAFCEQVPRADLALNFSGHFDTLFPLRLTAPLTLQFDEFGPARELVREIRTLGASEAPFSPGTAIVLESGAAGAGYYLYPPDSLVGGRMDGGLLSRRETALRLKSAGLDLGSDSFLAGQLAFGYSKRPESLELYLRTIVRWAENSTSPITVILKADPGRREFSLPKNVTVITFESLPHELFEALVYHSDLPPFVSGDVSLSMAFQQFLSRGDSRALFAEVQYDLKRKEREIFIDEIVGNPTFAQAFGRQDLEKARADLRTALGFRSDLSIQDTSSRLAEIALDSRLWDGVKAVLKARAGHLSLLENALKFYEIARLFRSELETGAFSKTQMELLFRIAQDSSNRDNLPRKIMRRLLAARDARGCIPLAAFLIKVGLSKSEEPVARKLSWLLGIASNSEIREFMGLILPEFGSRQTQRLLASIRDSGSVKTQAGVETLLSFARGLVPDVWIEAVERYSRRPPPGPSLRKAMALKGV